MTILLNKESRLPYQILERNISETWLRSVYVPTIIFPINNNALNKQYIPDNETNRTRF